MNDLKDFLVGNEWKQPKPNDSEIVRDVREAKEKRSLVRIAMARLKKMFRSRS